VATIYAECPSCGAEGKLDDALVGRRIKCNKCGNPFTLEIGGTYDVIQAEAEPARTETTTGAPRAGTGPGRPAAKPEPADPDLLKRLEDWAEE
jgi:hypothetical protein